MGCDTCCEGPAPAPEEPRRKNGIRINVASRSEGAAKSVLLRISRTARNCSGSVTGERDDTPEEADICTLERWDILNEKEERERDKKESQRESVCPHMGSLPAAERLNFFDT